MHYSYLVTPIIIKYNIATEVVIVANFSSIEIMEGVNLSMMQVCENIVICLAKNGKTYFLD